MTKINTIRDIRFLLTAQRLAEIWSKDPITKVAAIVVGAQPNQVAWGYNGFPPGLADSAERLHGRDWKNAHTLHAEQNAILNATFEPETLYSTHYPCAERCALMILGKRTIRRVVTLTPNAAYMERWGTSVCHSAELFDEAGLTVTMYTPRMLEQYLATGEVPIYIDGKNR